ncbi:hypothetical protein Lesp02_79560 [Lentzea sp. NBRC 105346]|nr:hypothetical protein Lesp02_79560 [Lentzea sp. NBRC 105346]
MFAPTDRPGWGFNAVPPAIAQPDKVEDRDQALKRGLTPGLSCGRASPAMRGEGPTTPVDCALRGCWGARAARVAELGGAACGYQEAVA